MVHSYLSAQLPPIQWTDTHGTREMYAVLWSNQGQVVVYSYSTKIKYSYQNVAVLSSVSLPLMYTNSD